MTRWRMFWLTYLAAGGLCDTWRESRDIKAGRTHSTGTTLSASTRWLVERMPAGRLLFALGCVVVPRWFEGHILRPTSTA